MTTYRFKFIDEAKAEYEAAALYYLNHAGHEVAERFILKVNTVIEMLEMWPKAGRDLETIPGVKCSVIPKYPYCVYYRIDSDVLEVIGLSLYHTKRDLAKIFPILKARVK